MCGSFIVFRLSLLFGAVGCKFVLPFFLYQAVCVLDSPGLALCSFLSSSFQLLFGAVGCCCLVQYLYAIFYWESQVGQVCFTTSDRLSLFKDDIALPFSFTRPCRSLIAQGCHCLVSQVSLFHFCFSAVGCCCFQYYICDLVLGESSGTGLFYHFRQALSVTDDFVLFLFSFPSLCFSCP